MRQAWNTFERNREHLFNQFIDTPFEPDTGLSLEDLEAAVDSYLSQNQDQPRVLQKANVFRIVLSLGQICIDPRDWFVDKLNHGGIRQGRIGRNESERASLAGRLSLRWLDEAMAGPLAETSEWLHRAYRVGWATGPKAGLDRGHIAPGWDTLLAGGLAGLLEQAARARTDLGAEASAEQLAFLDALEIVYRAIMGLAGRFAVLADEMQSDYPEHRDRLGALAAACRQVPAHRPRTFHEALQFVWLMHEMIEIEGEYVRSMGQFDRSLYTFFREDIGSGRLTREQAKELLKYFWYKWYSRTRGRDNGKNFCFGGQYPDGSEITNELTYLALEAYGELGTPDPKLSVRFLPATSDKLYGRVADLIRGGQNSFVLMNDETAVKALRKRGKSKEDARFYLPIGCYEPAVEGKEAACTMNITVNLAKGIELALFDGIDPSSGELVGRRTGDPRAFKHFGTFWNAYTEQLDHFLTRARECIQAAEEHWPQINPSPVVGGTIADCIARGRDVGQGGPVYNSVGFVGAGLANAADSLLALETAVFAEKKYSMGALLDALGGNFAGCEGMRQYLVNHVPKWGNNDPAADRLARKVADYYCGKVHSFTNGRGGPCQAALFTLQFAWHGGRLTGALPDGRKAGESLAPGIGATYGHDWNGVTALIESVTKLDYESTPNGAVLDVTLHPSAVHGKEGLQALVALIKTFFVKGGYAVQFNIMDAETLRAAQRHPEKYATLQVRLTGWSVYFTQLSPFEQAQLIARCG